MNSASMSGAYGANETIQQVQTASRPEKSVSIDDFLHCYRPRPCHVQHFLACCGAPFDALKSVHAQTINTSQVNFSLEQNAANALPLSIKSSDLRSIQPSQSKERGPAYMDNCLELGQRAAKHPAVSKQAVRISKQASAQLTASGKAERRRDQNREAQRRYRERQMYLGL